jgi:2-polyprenyl-3-methyl-5-hydroxy-6-metoxy-1,4-benzoquinol methylase
VSFTPEQVDAGQSIYTKKTLAAYDFIVLGISNHLLWKCSTQRLLAHYNKYVTANHLDVGVGTGYFLERCKFPSKTPRVALMDLNPNTLEYASTRISHYEPEIYRQNILEPISMNIPLFDSIGINYLLHCLPGSISEKAIVFDHLSPVMNKNTAIFGSTILQGRVPITWAAKRLMHFYNKKGIFSNTADDLSGLENVLQQRFKNVVVEVVGCVALFSGHCS